MTTCSVRNCQESGSEVLESPKLSGFEALVCSEHKTATDDGSPWISGDDNKSLLMGNDVPPGLAEWKLVETIGTGAVLHIKTDREGEEPIELYVTKESLKAFIQSFPGA